MTNRYLSDLAERVGVTYVEALVGLLIAGWTNVASLGDVLTLGRAAVVAALPAALAVVKAGLARFVGDAADASLVR